jgi:hypothetical protein
MVVAMMVAMEGKLHELLFQNLGMIVSHDESTKSWYVLCRYNNGDGENGDADGQGDGNVETVVTNEDVANGTYYEPADDFNVTQVSGLKAAGSQ